MSHDVPPVRALLKFVAKWLGLALLAVVLVNVAVFALGADPLWVAGLSFLVAIAVVIGVMTDRKNLYRE